MDYEFDPVAMVARTSSAAAEHTPHPVPHTSQHGPDGSGVLDGLAKLLSYSLGDLLTDELPAVPSGPASKAASANSDWLLTPTPANQAADGCHHRRVGVRGMDASGVAPSASNLHSTPAQPHGSSNNRVSPPRGALNAHARHAYRAVSHGTALGSGVSPPDDCGTDQVLTSQQLRRAGGADGAHAAPSPGIVHELVHGLASIKHQATSFLDTLDARFDQLFTGAASSDMQGSLTSQESHITEAGAPGGSHGALRSAPSVAGAQTQAVNVMGKRHGTPQRPGSSKPRLNARPLSQQPLQPSGQQVPAGTPDKGRSGGGANGLHVPIGVTGVSGGGSSVRVIHLATAPNAATPPRTPSGPAAARDTPVECPTTSDLTAQQLGQTPQEPCTPPSQPPAASQQAPARLTSLLDPKCDGCTASRRVLVRASRRVHELMTDNTRLRGAALLDPQLSDCVCAQLQSLLADKARLVADNCRLQREVAGLQQLLAYTWEQQAAVESEDVSPPPPLIPPSALQPWATPTSLTAHYNGFPGADERCGAGGGEGDALSQHQGAPPSCPALPSPAVLFPQPEEVAEVERFYSNVLAALPAAADPPLWMQEDASLCQRTEAAGAEDRAVACQAEVQAAQGEDGQEVEKTPEEGAGPC